MQFFSFTLLTLFVTLALSSSRISSEPTQENESELQKYFNQLEARDLDEGWQDLSVGLLIKRDEQSSDSTFEKRANSQPRSAWTIVRRDPSTGKVLLPSTLNAVTQLIKRNVPDLVKRHAKRMAVKITWYSGHDLLNPSCFPDSADWAPTDNSLVGATTIEWPGKPKCGAFVQIRHASKSHKKVTVRIADSCAGCATGTAHIDLTRRAFSTLYDLNVGAVSGLQAKIVHAPVGHNWSDNDVALYGPKKCLQS